MAYSINAWTRDWQATGQSVPFPQYELTIRVAWTDDQGVQHNREEQVLFPNCLAGEFAPAEQKDIAEGIMLRAARKRLGVGE